MGVVPYLYKRLVAAGISPSQASLMSRSSSTAGKSNFEPNTSIYGSDAARANTRRALGYAMAAKSSVVPITLVGDSAISGWKANTIGTDDYATLLIGQLKSLGYPVTGGWVYAGNGNTPGDTRWAFSGTNSWQGRTSTTNNYVWTSATGNIATFTSTATGTVVEFACVTTTAAQTVNYSIDGGGSTSFPLTANVMNIKTVTGLTSGTHTVAITSTGAATVWLCGARVRDTAGLSISNAGIYGSHSNDWTPTGGSGTVINPYSLTTAVAGQPKLVIITLGGNDALHGTDGAPAYTPATHLANLNTIVSGFQAAGSTVVLRAYPYVTSAAQATIATKQAAGVTWDSFINNIYTVADALDTVVIDHSTLLGDPNTLETAGLMYSDHLHFLTPGQGAIARADARALTMM